MARDLTKLVVLWLLSEGPSHGYRIKTILDEASLRFWFPLEAGSIYSVLATLKKQELVIEEAVEREGKRPERTRFKITPAGREHLRELIRAAWTELPRMAEPINLALAAASELPESEVREFIRQREKAIQNRLEQLEAVARSAPASEMVDRLHAITQAELEWVQAL